MGALRPAAGWLHCQLFPSDLGAPLSLALERFCQRQHGRDSPLTPRLPSSIRFIKASIQQLWHPRERVGRTPESDFLSAGEVAQHPDSSRGEKMRQLLQWGGDALPLRPWLPPLLLLHHGGQQWRIQEEEKGRQDMESNIIKNVHWSLNHK